MNRNLQYFVCFSKQFAFASAFLAHPSYWGIQKDCVEDKYLDNYKK